MPLHAWVTQPKRPFDSFYFYDTDTHGFVRIRLELGRKDANPAPGVFAKENRYVGFVDETKGFDFKDFDRWSVNRESKIVYRIDEFNDKILDNKAVAGKKVIDFSLGDREVHPTFIHHGNPVVDGPFRLPRNSEGNLVTVGMLKTIAGKVIGQDTRIVLGQATSTEEQLADAIFLLYYQLKAVPV
jgi:hypothetical protein